MRDRPNTTAVEESLADYFWSESLEPIDANEVTALMENDDELDSRLNDGSIISRDSALERAGELDDEVVDPDYFRE